MRRDLVYAARSMAAHPGLYAAAVLTLALGIGVNTAMFSVLDAVLLRPLPLRQPERVVTILARIPHLNIRFAFVEYNTFSEWWRARNKSFEDMAAYTPGSANLLINGEAEQVSSVRVSASFLRVLGTQPALGRDFTPEEDRPGAPAVAILSHGMWQRRFGSDRGIIGKTIVLDKKSYAVIGVLPREFDFVPGDVFAPIAQSAARAMNEPSVGAYARLKPGISSATAQSEIDVLCRGWVNQYHYPSDWGGEVIPLHRYLERDMRSYVLLLSAAVTLVLLIACANVANILLARAGARNREIAIRTALGAARGRIIRQLLTESSLLAVMGAAPGLLLAWGCVRALIASQPSLPFLSKVFLDLWTLMFALSATVLTTILSGLAPAVATARTNLSEDLKEGGRTSGDGAGRSRMRDSLVVFEVALAILMVVGATLTVYSLLRLQAVNPGFNAENIAAASVRLSDADYREPSRRVAFFTAVLDRLSRTPGIESASMVSDLPFGGSRSGGSFVIEGAPPPKPGEQPIAFVRAVDPGYFRTLQVRLLYGRLFNDHDVTGPPVAVINETMARRCWPGQDAAGRRFGNGRPDGWVTVLGVVSDMHNTALDEPPDPEYYLMYVQHPTAAMALVVRTRGDPLGAAPAIRAAVREEDRQAPISEVTALAETISGSTGSRRFSTALLGGFAALAVMLAAIGIYGVVCWSVARRTREIGVRMALGATRRSIAVMVLRRVVALAGAGVVIGVAGSLALARLVRSMLYEVSPTDATVLTASCAFVLLVAVIAAAIPMRRAARSDPLIALRHE
ncbi:MAG TPA: ABC transporter permease [Bryobacteraceae bacterium]|nr:ABC transporter permease [Bryobacteraceae bacterium]